MLISLAIATLVGLLAVSLVLLGQGLRARQKGEFQTRRHQVFELAKQHDGIVDAEMVSEALGLSYARADRFLRQLVDDDTFTMGVDEKKGALQFWYPSLTLAPERASGDRKRNRRSQVPAPPEPGR